MTNQRKKDARLDKVTTCEPMTALKNTRLDETATCEPITTHSKLTEKKKQNEIYVSC